jgi:hypothetical protein
MVALSFCDFFITEKSNSFTVKPVDVLKIIGFMDICHMKAKEGQGLDGSMDAKLFVKIISDLLYSLFRLKLFYNDLNAIERVC